MSRASCRVIAALLCTCLMLSGCAPYIQKSERRTASSGILLADKFIASDGEVLPLSVWHAAQQPIAIVLGIHGFNDYRNAFAGVAAYLAGQGISFYAYDQRGFGATKHRGLWPGADSLRNDVYEVVAALRSKHPGVAVYLLGDSMGGAVVMTATAAQASLAVDGIILNAPAVWGGQTFNRFYRLSLWTMAHTLPAMRVGKSGVSMVLTDNRALIKQLQVDPWMIRETRFDVLYGLVGLMDEALEKAALINKKTLLLYGLRDTLIPKTSICRIASAMHQPTTTLFYANGYHLLLRDLQAPKVWADIDSWIRNTVVRSPPLPTECVI